MLISITKNIEIVWIIENNYGISRNNEIYNLKTNRKLKQSLVNYTVGYYLKGKFRSLKYIRQNCKKYKEVKCPF